MRLRTLFLLLIFTVATGLAPAYAQSGSPAPMAPLATHDPRLEKITEAMHASKSPAWAALSPDGATVAWTLRRKEGAQIHLTEVANPKNDKILAPSKADCASEEPVWSPDGTTLAFTSTCTPKSEKPEQEQIFLWTKSTGAFKQLTHLTGNIDSLAFSPDGKSIGFLFVENATRSAGALAAMKPWSGVIGEDGVEIQRVYGINVSNGKGDFITPRDLHVYEFDWSPDSKRIAFVGANPPGENNWWVAKLYTIGRVSNEKGEFPDGPHIADTIELSPSLILDPTTIPGPLHGLQIAVPRFSPDGSQIAFIGGIMSDQGSTGGDVWVVPSNGGEPKDITPNIDGTPTFIAWLNNNRIGMVEERRGRIRLPDFDVASGAEIPGSADDLGEVTLSGGAIKDAVTFSRNGTFALIKSSFQTPPEVYAGPLNALKQITHLNDGIKPVWGKSESIEWDNEGFHNQGWLLYPAQYDPAKKYPLIVEVHGGPSASIGSRWGGGGALFSAMNYFVFSPNPRGSYGQGERFTQANVKDFGYGDLRDILKGMDTLEARLPIDKNREGLTGWSYGGFMTMFGVTQTNRFKAAVAGAGISDWKSYYGENSIDQWMLPFFGKTVYDDPAVYAKSSAIEYIKNVKTPTLVIVGDRDGECPAPQSFELWHALRAEGVKTQLVVYPNEGHGFRDPAHIADRNERMLQWFATQMP
jgi:dipeptidyl aminopeptidase/acylaminoacyl peptidase